MTKRVWYFSNYDGDKRGTGRDPWVENEDRARKLIADEGEVEGADKVEYRTFTDARGRTVKLAKDAGMGLSGQDITIHGERVSFLKKEIEVKGGRPTGNVIAYYQSEKGGTIPVTAEKVGEGRHRLIVGRRIRSF